MSQHVAGRMKDLKYGDIWRNPAGKYYQSKKMDSYLRFLLGDASSLQKNMLVLDAGCADAVNTRKFASLGCRMVGLDLSTVKLKDAMDVVQETANGMSLAIDLVRGDVNNLPFRKGSFNNAISMAVFQYVNQMKALRELVRVTRLGGMVIIDISNRYCVYYLGLNRIVHSLFPRIDTYAGLPGKFSQFEMKTMFQRAGLGRIEIRPILLVHWNLSDRLFRFVKWIDSCFERLPLFRNMMGVLVCKGAKNEEVKPPVRSFGLTVFSKNSL